MSDRGEPTTLYRWRPYAPRRSSRARPTVTPLDGVWAALGITVVVVAAAALSLWLRPWA